MREIDSHVWMLSGITARIDFLILIESEALATFNIEWTQPTLSL